jgi:hypothetical protein
MEWLGTMKPVNKSIDPKYKGFPIMLNTPFVTVSDSFSVNFTGRIPDNFV